MTKNSRHAVILWTGGKDSCLALYEALNSGYDVTTLVTFAPRNPQFLAHPLHVMELQAQALQIPHVIFEVGEPLREGYTKALMMLRDVQGVGTLITGDIDTIDGHPNWIQECCSSLGLTVVSPLWKREREEILLKFIELGFTVVFSCVKKPWLSEEWVGRTLNRKSFAEMQAISRATGMDLCGEQGEYHTLVLDCPLFQRPISLKGCITISKDSMTYLDIKKISLAGEPIENVLAL